MFAAITIEPGTLSMIVGGLVLLGCLGWMWLKKPNGEEPSIPPSIVSPTPKTDEAPKTDEEDNHVDPNSPEAIAECWASLQYIQEWLISQKNDVALEHLDCLRRDLFIKPVPPTKKTKAS